VPNCSLFLAIGKLLDLLPGQCNTWSVQLSKAREVLHSAFLIAPSCDSSCVLFPLPGFFFLFVISVLSFFLTFFVLIVVPFSLQVLFTNLLTFRLKQEGEGDGCGIAGERGI